MAVVTTAPKSAAMRVLRRVTVDTISSDLGPPRHRSAMATPARQILVSTMQNKARLDIMLELPTHPTVRIVAILAVPPEGLLMHIIRLVTRQARDIVDREGVIAMTGFARCDRMKPQQRESR